MIENKLVLFIVHYKKVRNQNRNEEKKLKKGTFKIGLSS